MRVGLKGEIRQEEHSSEQCAPELQVTHAWIQILALTSLRL